MAKKRKYGKDASSYEEISRKSDVVSSSIPPQDSTAFEAEKPFSLTCQSGLLVHEQPANYGLLNDPVDFKKTEALAVSLQRSRRTWLTGCMFEKFWTRPQRGRKLAEGQYNARDKMAKLCECKAQIGPHVFELRLFTVKDIASMEDVGGKLGLSANEDGNAAKPQSNVSSANMVTIPDDKPSVKHVSIEGPSVAADKMSQSQSSPVQAAAISSDAAERELDPSAQPNVVSVDSSPPTAAECEQIPTHAGQDVSHTTVTHDATEPTETPLHDPATIRQPQSSRASVSSSSKPPSKHPNEELIDRLHDLARRDPQFGELMKSVASGKASADEIRRFQVYIAQSRQTERSDVSPSSSMPSLQQSNDEPTYRSTPIAKLKPELKKKERELLRDQTIVFEFKENSTDRFLFPKESLVQLLPNGTVSALVFLLAEEPDESQAESEARRGSDREKKKMKSEDVAETDVSPRRCNPKYYTPLNITFYGIPRKLQDIFIRAVHPREEVIKYFKETSARLKHSKDWWVYYKVNSTDTESINKVVDPIGSNNPNLKKKPWSTNKDADSTSGPSRIHVSGIS
ncbi:hypothetical protein V1525DRAFT_393365 [Lipomyces kononenkoae]|uniref:Uncharacterized protein n=1 Tax=Lipomyces kononenkoae TaxID=34357 RepID=A0ACC3TAJ0_LIPKO